MVQRAAVARSPDQAKLERVERVSRFAYIRFSMRPAVSLGLKSNRCCLLPGGLD